MAVHTELAPATIEGLLSQYGFSRVGSVEHATQGIENSNFFVEATSAKGDAELVVTLFESELPGDGFVLRLLDQLSANGLPVPAPYRTASGERITLCDGRAAMVVERFPGSHPISTTPKQCRQIGAFLGRMHLAAAPLLDVATSHPRDSEWLQTSAEEALPLLGAQAKLVLDEALAYVLAFLSRIDVQALPRGVVHGDLFRDNALFEGEQLVAVIDFHHASKTMLAFDLAVALNDWVVDSQGVTDERRRSAFVQGYEQMRPLNLGEHTYLDAQRVYAALCFWLSRLAQVKRIAKWGQTHLPPWRLDRVLSTGQAKDPRWFERLVCVLLGLSG